MFPARIDSRNGTGPVTSSVRRPFHRSFSPLREHLKAPSRADPAFRSTDIRLTPHYPKPVSFAGYSSSRPPRLRLITLPRSTPSKSESQLRQWSESLKTSARDLSSLAKSLDASIQASLLVPSKEVPLVPVTVLTSVRSFVRCRANCRT